MRSRRNGESYSGDLSPALLGGVKPSLHGEKPPAIDRGKVRDEWRRIWRIILADLTPIQRKALLDELRKADG